MLALARHPNIGVKMSGAPSYSSQPYPYKNIHGYLRQIFEAFGPDRSFWGTDITRMPCSYRQCVTMFTEELPWLKGRDLERVMGGAVIDWLGWKRPAAYHTMVTASRSCDAVGGDANSAWALIAIVPSGVTAHSSQPRPSAVGRP